MIRVILQVFKNYILQKSISLKDWARYFFTSKGQLIQIRINGFPVWIRKGSPDLYVALGCLYGEFEILRRACPVDYDGVIVDAGGYTGLSALALRRLFPEAQIVVIEPALENLDLLKKNLSTMKNLRIVHGALVGRDKGPVHLKNRGTGEWGFTAVERPLDNADAPTMHSVPAVTLGSLGLEPSEIGILKLDIEGGEYDLFSHDRESLNQVGVVYAELHDRIISGCSDLFLEYSKERTLIKCAGEKFLSVREGEAVCG